jgi:hypothetical protein
MTFRVWCLYSYLVDDTVYIRTCMNSYNRLMRRQAYSQLPSITLLFTQKVVTKLSKIWVSDPGSGKTYPGFRGQKLHWIPYPDPQH